MITTTFGRSARLGAAAATPDREAAAAEAPAVWMNRRRVVGSAIARGYPTLSAG